MSQVDGVSSDAINRVSRRLVEFLVFNSIHSKISVPSNGRNRVIRKLDFLVREGYTRFIQSDETGVELRHQSVVFKILENGKQR